MILKILFVNSHYYLPQSFGGMANTLHQLCMGLSARNHQVLVLSGFRAANDLFGIFSRVEMAVRKRTSAFSASRDTRLGYTVWRSWTPELVLDTVVKTERPDIIVIMGGAVVPIARSARKTETPIVVQVHDVEEKWHRGDFREVVDLPLIANSYYTADTYKTRYGAKAQVIYPFMPLDDYKVESNRQKVCLINPIFRKGLRLGHAIAKLCPDIDFVFVGALPRTDEMGNPFHGETLALPNLTFKPFCNDMREVYRECQVLLMPSQWEEAYGRVVNEAQISGIPVLASRRGGIPEALGRGGVLLEADDAPEVWAKTLEGMIKNRPYYEELSVAALESAQRIELNAEFQLQAHEQALEDAIAFFDPSR